MVIIQPPLLSANGTRHIPLVVFGGEGDCVIHYSYRVPRRYAGAHDVGVCQKGRRSEVAVGPSRDTKHAP
jgi:hypothetical protein